ncbi:MAG: twin-arginine translocase TatA/TatE family subunit [Bauldia sp.]|nr:twin-arginine translocase TatA/TatE family subunit [Bauldia sp.]
MGSFSIWHWMIVIVVVLLLFGRGKISSVMGDLAGGIKSFKRGMADDDAPPVDPARVADGRETPIPVQTAERPAETARPLT